MQFKELGSNYLITLHTEESNDAMTVEVELGQDLTDDYTVLQRLTYNIARALHDEILLTAHSSRQVIAVWHTAHIRWESYTGC